MNKEFFLGDQCKACCCCAERDPALIVSLLLAMVNSFTAPIIEDNRDLLKRRGRRVRARCCSTSRVPCLGMKTIRPALARRPSAAARARITANAVAA